jgi:hypothetical protein
VTTRKPIDAMLDAVEWEEIPGGPASWNDALPVATHEGVLRVMDFELKCYQLSNGMRVFDADDLARAFGWELKE